MIFNKGTIGLYSIIVDLVSFNDIHQMQNYFSGILLKCSIC